MAIIRVRELSINATSSGLSKFFSDTFVRAGSIMGPNWAQGGIINTPVGICSFPTYVIGTAPDLTNAMGINSVSPAGPTQDVWGFNIPIPCYAGIFGQSQFAQCLYLTNQGSVANTTFGLAVMTRMDTIINSYQLSFNSTVAGSYQVLKSSPNGTNAPGSNLAQTTLSLINAGAVPATGTILRISADLSVGGQITIRVSHNGVNQLTVVDNTPLIGGSPGFYCQSASTGTVWIRNFSCGVGL
jgi:hypothetical protein